MGKQIETVENQKIMINNKTNDYEENLFTRLNIDNAFDVMKDLKYSEFKVWFYVIKNADKYEFAFSSQHCADVTGISKRTVQEAMRALETKGYLIKKSNTSNKYDFYEKNPSIEKNDTYSGAGITVHKA